MSDLYFLEGPGDIDPTKLDNFSAGLHYLATVAKIDPSMTVTGALWGPQVMSGPMNGWFSKVKKVAGKVGKGVTHTVADYASDIKKQGVGTALARVSAAVATGGLSEAAFAAKSAISSVPGATKASTKQAVALALAASSDPVTVASTEEQIEAAGSHWKAIQEKAKAVANFKFVGIPLLILLPVTVGGLWFVASRGKKKAA